MVRTMQLSEGHRRLALLGHSPSFPSYWSGKAMVWSVRLRTLSNSLGSRGRLNILVAATPPLISASLRVNGTYEL